MPYSNLILAAVAVVVGLATLIAPQLYWNLVVSKLYKNPQAIEPNKNGMRMWRVSGLMLFVYGLFVFARFFF